MVESNLLWYSKVKTITLSLDNFFSADSDNEIVIIETSLGYLLKSAISITDYYHICSLCLLTENDMILKMKAKPTWKEGRKLNFKSLL